MGGYPEIPVQLRQLDLCNFRSFVREGIPFERRLTVLVGENNGGKSNVIDAIRLLTSPLGGRRDLYCEQSDVRFGSASSSFELVATFDGLSAPQQGRLLSATTSDTLEEACFGLTYDVKPGQSRVRPSLWSGRFRGVPEPGSHETVRHVYLPPLRDARRALASGNPTRVYALLSHFLGNRNPEEVARHLARGSEDQILAEVDSAVATGLDQLTAGVRRQNAALGFSADEQLIDIARDLRFKLADHGVTPEDLRYSGHGFANLLFMATIAVELEKADDTELTIFLVEEPEAHLHPQLQAAVLSFLEDRADASVNAAGDSDAPAGHVQVIVATHSPNLSAWVPSKSLVFVRSIEPPAVDEYGGGNPSDTEPISQQTVGEAQRDSQVGGEEGEIAVAGIPTLGDGAGIPGPQARQEALPRHESRCIPLASLGLSEPERRKIDRYLDVTKSALLFGGRVLLVEGIAEALLLPAIAKHHVLKDRSHELSVFRSAVFVPIGGVDFEPYAKALLSPYNGVRIAERLVVITDGDMRTEEEGADSPGDKRKAALDALAVETGAEGFLDVFVNSYSLEAELVEVGNATLMKAVYLAHHPRSEEQWDLAVGLDGLERAQAVQGLFSNTPKGDFAQLLAERIVDDGAFEVPGYIREAIEALVK